MVRAFLSTRTVLAILSVLVLISLSGCSDYRKGHLRGRVLEKPQPIVNAGETQPSAYSIVVGDDKTRMTVCVKNPVLFPSVAKLEIGTWIICGFRMHKETMEIELLTLEEKTGK
jgi:hypothetical protein